jgi:hypothetical protein
MCRSISAALLAAQDVEHSACPGSASILRLWRPCESSFSLVDQMTHFCQKPLKNALICCQMQSLINRGRGSPAVTQAGERRLAPQRAPCWHSQAIQLAHVRVGAHSRDARRGKSDGRILSSSRVIPTRTITGH